MERLAQRRQQLDHRKEQLQDDVLKFDTFLKVPGRGPGLGWAGRPAKPHPHTAGFSGEAGAGAVAGG